MGDEKDRESEPQKAIEEGPQELLAERKEEQTDEELVEGYDPFCDVKELLDREAVALAQARLEQIKERGAPWHYWQSIIYRKRNWLTESKKSLETAIGLDPKNKEYKSALAELNDMAEGGKRARLKKEKKSKGERLADDCGNGCCEGCCLGCC